MCRSALIDESCLAEVALTAASYASAATSYVSVPGDSMGGYYGCLILILILLHPGCVSSGGLSGTRARVLSRDSNWIIIAVPNDPNVDHLTVTYHAKKAASNASSQRHVSSGAHNVLTFQKAKDSVLSSSSSLSSASSQDVDVELTDTGSALTWTDDSALQAARIEDQLRPPLTVERRPAVVQFLQSPPPAARLVLSEDFSSPELDTTKWSHDVTASGGRFSMFTPEPINSFVKNGILHIRPTFTEDSFGKDFLSRGTLDFENVWGRCTQTFNGGCRRSAKERNIPPVMSARIYSRVAISHGRVEVVARLPRGDWLWPAIWLCPDRQNTKYGPWPQSGEIDIMESRGNANLTDAKGLHHGGQLLFTTIHYGPAGHRIKRKSYKKAKPGSLWSDDYHTFTLDWTADHMRTEVDGEPLFVWSTPKEGYFALEKFDGPNIWSSGGPDAPFDGKFNLVLDVVAGDPKEYFDETWVNRPHPKPWRNHDPGAMADFWRQRQHWQHTWHEDHSALRIKSVRMFQY